MAVGTENQATKEADPRSNGADLTDTTEFKLPKLPGSSEVRAGVIDKRQDQKSNLSLPIARIDQPGVDVIDVQNPADLGPLHTPPTIPDPSASNDPGFLSEIEALYSSSFAVREDATKNLISRGEEVIPALLALLDELDDPGAREGSREVIYRSSDIINHYYRSHEYFVSLPLSERQQESLSLSNYSEYNIWELEEAFRGALRRGDVGEAQTACSAITEIANVIAHGHNCLDFLEQLGIERDSKVARAITRSFLDAVSSDDSDSLERFRIEFDAIQVLAQRTGIQDVKIEGIESLAYSLERGFQQIELIIEQNNLSPDQKDLLDELQHSLLDAANSGDPDRVLEVVSQFKEIGVAQRGFRSLSSIDLRTGSEHISEYLDRWLNAIVNYDEEELNNLRSEVTGIIMKFKEGQRQRGIGK